MDREKKIGKTGEKKSKTSEKPKTSEQKKAKLGRRMRWAPDGSQEPDWWQPRIPKSERKITDADHNKVLISVGFLHKDGSFDDTARIPITWASVTEDSSYGKTPNFTREELEAMSNYTLASIRGEDKKDDFLTTEQRKLVYDFTYSAYFNCKYQYTAMNYFNGYNYQGHSKPKFLSFRDTLKDRKFTALGWTTPYKYRYCSCTIDCTCGHWMKNSDDDWDHTVKCSNAHWEVTGRYWFENASVYWRYCYFHSHDLHEIRSVELVIDDETTLIMTALWCPVVNKVHPYDRIATDKRYRTDLPEHYFRWMCQEEEPVCRCHGDHKTFEHGVQFDTEFTCCQCNPDYATKKPIADIKFTVKKATKPYKTDSKKDKE